MGPRKLIHRSRTSRPRKLARGAKHRCMICEELFDSPTLSIKLNKGRAHILCAVLQRVGLGHLARSSGRW